MENRYNVFEIQSLKPVEKETNEAEDLGIALNPNKQEEVAGMK